MVLGGTGGVHRGVLPADVEGVGKVGSFRRPVNGPPPHFSSCSFEAAFEREPLDLLSPALLAWLDSRWGGANARSGGACINPGGAGATGVGITAPSVGTEHRGTASGTGAHRHGFGSACTCGRCARSGTGASIEFPRPAADGALSTAEAAARNGNGTKECAVATCTGGTYDGRKSAVGGGT